jgi:hypothetical protein
MKAAHKKPVFRIPFPVVVLLLCGFLSFFFIPCTGMASDETASFDEEESSSGSEMEGSGTLLLHADYYQPSVYSPDRQVRTVAPTPWIRLLPFAALVLLALVTSRLFTKRRHVRLAGAPAKLEKAAAITIGVSLAILTGVGVSNAQPGNFQGGFPQGGFQGRGGGGGFQSQVYATVEEGVSSLLGSDRKIFEKEIDITGDAKQMLKNKTGWAPSESSIKVYYSKSPEGSVEAYAFVLSEILAKCGGTHKYCIKISSEGVVEGVDILELNCHHSYGVNNEWFLNQFDGLTTETLGSTRIDAVTRATLSSNLTKDVVLHALALFELAEGRSNV